MAPAHYIAPWVAPTWDDVVAIFKKALAESPADASLAFFGFDVAPWGSMSDGGNV